MNKELKHLTIFSDFSEMHKVEKFVEDICDHYNINNNYFSNIIMVLTEAVSNAIVHGNKENKSLKVSINFDAVPSGLRFSIEDEGAGFDSTKIQDPTDINVEFNENSGTGLFLMERLSDEIKFLKNGRKIVVLFDTASINYELSVQRRKEIKKYFGITEFAGNEYLSNNAN